MFEYVRPFERLWWDETVSTVVTRAEPHNQDRVLKIRENARLQGFPDFYKLYGPTKERYIQVGNAVAIPVSRSLGLALLGIADDQPLCSLLSDFSSFIRGQVSSEEVDEVSPL
ncbi:hypothetical protein IFM89_010214 [Coptis chinensis]|uniref:DNA (cytosine-5-)-methyltransferase n=1 Tax=Coptis chinensis TaxID=261450 RepID=A0A835GVT0_9MAGN|nr:hypothetical protein IFM89_010214 [Coptis chinensis]